MKTCLVLVSVWPLLILELPCFFVPRLYFPLFLSFFYTGFQLFFPSITRAEHSGFSHVHRSAFLSKLSSDYWTEFLWIQKNFKNSSKYSRFLSTAQNLIMIFPQYGRSLENFSRYFYATILYFFFFFYIKLPKNCFYIDTVKTYSSRYTYTQFLFNPKANSRKYYVFNFVVSEVEILFFPEFLNSYEFFKLIRREGELFPTNLTFILKSFLFKLFQYFLKIIVTLKPPSPLVTCKKKGPSTTSNILLEYSRSEIARRGKKTFPPRRFASYPY